MCPLFWRCLRRAQHLPINVTTLPDDTRGRTASRLQHGGPHFASRVSQLGYYSDMTDIGCVDATSKLEPHATGHLPHLTSYRCNHPCWLERVLGRQRPFAENTLEFSDQLSTSFVIHRPNSSRMFHALTGCPIAVLEVHWKDSCDSQVCRRDRLFLAAQHRTLFFT